MRTAAPDLAIAALLFVFGAYMLVQSLAYGLLVQGGRIGPGFMPFVAGTLLAIFSVWIGVEVVRRAHSPESAAPSADPSPVRGGKRVEEWVDELPVAAATTLTGDDPEVATGDTTDGEAGPTDTGPSSNRIVMAVFGLTVLATILTYFIGYVVAFGLITFVILAAVERERLWLSALVGAAAVAVAWAVFVQLLGVPLPGGTFQILGGG